MMTFAQIVAKTNKQRKFLAQYVKLMRVKQGINQEGRFVAAQSYSTHEWDQKKGRMVPVKEKRTYVTMVTVVNERRKHVKIACSCLDFMYRSEYALNQKGAADIEYSNGQPPNETNPTLKPQACKHAVKLFFYMQNLAENKGPNKM